MIAVISDIHGNYPALKAVFETIDGLNCEQVISLGDVAGYYCMINECIELCQRKRVVNILGNHDYYLVNNERCPRSNTANLCLDYQRTLIKDKNMEWLSQSIALFDNDIFSMRHGGWSDPLDEYIKEFNFDIIKDKRQQVFLSGHTHIPQLVRCDDKLYCNPGSVGQPRDGDNRASFITVDDDLNIKRYRISYDIDMIAQEMKRCGFYERVYSCLYEGVQIGNGTI